ncbi:auxin binding protein 1 [Prunus yedoensis var. nudiflora]|uniref:Auxin binding protein 1 n=1 Tax=Prunus yedoensis var. nudiflora TaxID=2094558 RepID=A0A314UD21_PRUYE|nr:auxin binding protein 1 [Prunus yedoensis var. nudiflora]
MAGPSLTIFFLSLLFFCAISEASKCSVKGLPEVRNISALPQSNYGRGGLAHTTVAGSLLHGLNEDQAHQYTGILVKKFLLS